MAALIIEKYQEADLPALTEIWNQVVEEGEAFPQREPLTEPSAREFFAAQSFTAAAKLDGQVVGLYILHPNNVGRCGHQANASYAVRRDVRGNRVGEQLVRHCLETAGSLGYRLLIFNAVVKENQRAIRLYEKLGFCRIGQVPGGFFHRDGTYHDTILFYHTL